jgi:hypothetical protein
VARSQAGCYGGLDTLSSLCYNKYTTTLEDNMEHWIKLNTVLNELADRKVIKSMAMGRRLLQGGAIKIDGETIKENVSLDNASSIQVGKRIIDLTDSL